MEVPEKPETILTNVDTAADHGDERQESSQIDLEVGKYKLYGVHISGFTPEGTTSSCEATVKTLTPEDTVILESEQADPYDKNPFEAGDTVIILSPDTEQAEPTIFRLSSFAEINGLTSDDFEPVDEDALQT